MPDADVELMTLEQRKKWLKLNAEGRKKARGELTSRRLEGIPYMPGADNVLVLRMPPPAVEKVTAGGLHIPETSQEEPEPKSEGYLLEGGPMALDAFLDEGYVVGDKVQIGRFAGWEKEFQADQEGKSKPKILQMKAGDVIGSFDLLDRLDGAKPTMARTLDPTTERHVIRVL